MNHEVRPQRPSPNHNLTGKSLSEALIFASNNPQYDKRLPIDLPAQYIEIVNLEHGAGWGEHVANIHSVPE